MSGVPILGRLVSSLIEQGFERLVVVVGYRGDEVRDYLDVHASGLEIHFIDSRYAAHVLRRLPDTSSALPGQVVCLRNVDYTRFKVFQLSLIWQD